MIFTVDYEHIFFDRYSLTEDEKKKEAIAILEKVFCDASMDKEGCTIEVCADCVEKEVELNKQIRMLKREFFLLLKMAEEKKEEIKAPDAIDIAERYIRENYLYEALCASKVCDSCNVGRKTLDKGFEKKFSKSVSEYIMALRVEKATALIMNGEKMELVAELCGFGSVKTMQRAFKSVCGKTPGEYRSGRLDSEWTK